MPDSASTANAATAAATRRAAGLSRLSAGPVLLLLLVLLSTPVAVLATTPPTLPYIPTTILLQGFEAGSDVSHHDGFAPDTAYIFSPSASSSSSVDLFTLNISSTLRASSIGLHTLSSGLPFLRDSATSTPFAPSLLSNGTIAAYVGGCGSVDAPALWSLNPPNTTTTSNGAAIWVNHDSPVSGSAAGGQAGASFLGGALSYSSQLEPTLSPASIYVYGGMCPLPNSSETGWTRSAYYSNQMLKLTHLADGAYNASPVVSKGPPVAEAGFSFTTLTPSVSNRSGIVTHQANLVLLGGHTRSAFVNMSTAAIWSLPQETWAFVSIAQPGRTITSTTELTVREDVGDGAPIVARTLPSTVDPRSGHTAVLSGDGTSLIVLGGWVGSTSEAAEPQLAVLEMGTTFDNWRWTIPPAQPSGQGIFGHGATLLPGNVMMVYGGYTIPRSGASVRRRQAGDADGIQMFLNLTSMTWTSEYTNPSYGSGTAMPGAEASSPPSSKNRDIGLGVGLGVGLAVLTVSIVAVILIRRRRRRRRRYARDSAMRALAQDGNMFLPEDEMAERDHDDLTFPWGSERAQDWYTGGGGPYARGTPAASSSGTMMGRSLGYESLRGSRSSPAFYSPVTRKPSGSRNTGSIYSSAPDGGLEATPALSPRLNRGPGDMNPIYEADEDGDPDTLPSTGPDARDMDTASDPFMTPASATAGVNFGATETSTSGARGQHREVQDWVSDVDTTDAVLSARICPHSTTTTKGSVAVAAAAGAVVAGVAGGHLSPARRASVRSKHGNSPSNASFPEEEARTASNLSDSNRSAFSYTMSRSGSVRSRPGTSSGIVALATAAAATGGSKDDDRRLESSSGSSASGNSFNTARTSFAALQAEGPTLLAGGGGDGTRPLSGSLIGGTSPSPPRDDEEELTPGSPSKNRARRSWFGSLRRVFSTSGPGSGETSRNESPLSFEGGDYEPRPAGLSGKLLRRKQGREAWEADDVAVDGAAEASTAAPASPTGGRYRSLGSHAGHDDDWDIERAVEQRLVQVMFTVPKERLRVVNAEIEREEEAEIVDPYPYDDDEFDGRQNITSNSRTAASAVHCEKTAPQGTDFQRSTPDSGKGKGKEQSHVVTRGEEEADLGLAMPAPAAPHMPDSGGDEWDPFWDGPAVGSLAGGPRLTAEMVRVPTPPELRGETSDDRGNEMGGSSSDTKAVASVPTESSRLSTEEQSHAIMTAKAVPLLRRQPTRVLEMVESIEREEGRSRTSTPGQSPARGWGGRDKKDGV